SATSETTAIGSPTGPAETVGSAPAPAASARASASAPPPPIGCGGPPRGCVERLSLSQPAESRAGGERASGRHTRPRGGGEGSGGPAAHHPDRSPRLHTASRAGV